MFEHASAADLQTGVADEYVQLYAPSFLCILLCWQKMNKLLVTKKIHEWTFEILTPKF